MNFVHGRKPPLAFLGLYRQYDLETVVGFFKPESAAGRSKYVYDPCDHFGSIDGVVCREQAGKLQPVQYPRAHTTQE